MIDDFINGNKPIFCYGCGEYGRVVLLYLRSRGIEIDGFVVSDKGNNKDICVLSVPVFELEDLPQSISDCSFIISLSESLHDLIKNRLIEKGCMDIYCVAAKEIVELRSQIKTNNLSIDKSGVLVLLYHRVAELNNDVWDIAVSPKQFEEQMKYLKENYSIIGLEDDWDNRETSIVITFDDGYIDNYKNALPVLERLRIPATFFICTGNIGSPREFWWDEIESIIYSSKKECFFWDGEMIKIDNDHYRNLACKRIHGIMKDVNSLERDKLLIRLEKETASQRAKRESNRSITESELRQMCISDVVNIGAHTVSHSCMSVLKRCEVIDEINESKRIIQSAIGKKIHDFSYPFGGFNDKSITIDSLLLQYGFSTISTTSGGVVRHGNEDKRCIPRNSVKSSINTISDYSHFLDITYAMSDGIII